MAVAATALGKLAPVVGAPVIGIGLGAAIALVRRPSETLRPGLAIASSRVLQGAVVVLGTQLSLTEILRTGVASLPVMIGTLAVCLTAAALLGRRLGVPARLRTLIGVGTGICGASAIAAVAPVIGATEADLAYAVPTIFLFNVTAVLTFPLLGHLLGLSQQSFGLFAGTAVNDMSSVVAASAAYGAVAAKHAVVVKLTRTLMIIPICLGLSASGSRPAASRVRTTRLVPWFLVGFLVAAGVASAGLIPHRVTGDLDQVSVYLITVALSAVGLTADVRALRRAGAKPLLLGACLWILVTGTSLSLQALFR